MIGSTQQEKIYMEGSQNIRNLHLLRVCTESEVRDMQCTDILERY